MARLEVARPEIIDAETIDFANMKKLVVDMNENVFKVTNGYELRAWRSSAHMLHITFIRPGQTSYHYRENKKGAFVNY